MNVYVSMDLTEVLCTKREILCGELANLGWQKVMPEGKVWKRVWDDSFPVEQLTEAARAHVAGAAKAAGVSKCEAIVVVSPHEAAGCQSLTHPSASVISCSSRGL